MTLVEIMITPLIEGENSNTLRKLIWTKDVDENCAKTCSAIICRVQKEVVEKKEMNETLVTLELKTTMHEM